MLQVQLLPSSLGWKTVPVVCDLSRSALCCTVAFLSLMALSSLCCRELLETTCRLANTLKRHGVHRGDRVAIYMPVSPLAVAAMLACARIGAVHTVVFAGFSADSLAGRINDGEHGWVWEELRSSQVLGVMSQHILTCGSGETVFSLALNLKFSNLSLFRWDSR